METALIICTIMCGVFSISGSIYHAQSLNRQDIEELCRELKADKEAN
jgi:hypothetical protein